MPKYLFTSDQRISKLPDRIKWVARYIQEGNDTAQIRDKSENNNASTLKFYYNLHAGTETCAQSVDNPFFAIRNFVKKFQFPNTRTPESLADSINEKVFLAPFRSVVTLLHLMANETGVSNISIPEILYYVFGNPTVYSNPLCDYNQVIKELLSARNSRKNLDEEIPNLIEWKQYKRGARELIAVITYASKCFRLSNSILFYNAISPYYQQDKDFINEILAYKTFWYPSNLADYKLSNLEYISYMDTKEIPYTVLDFNLINNIEKKKDSSNVPLQQIFYGAPGTGKSHEIKKLTKGVSVIRTTFHPDSDYSTFVGAYKPTMSEKEVRVVPVVVNNGISLNQNQGTYSEMQITYRFVIQAFLKAYLKAWKQYADGKNESTDSFVTKVSQPQKKQKNKDITVKVDGTVLVSDTSMADAGRQILAKFIELLKTNKSVDEIIAEWNKHIASFDQRHFNLTREKNTTSNWEKYLVINEECYFYAGIYGEEWPLFCDKVIAYFNKLDHQIEIVKPNSPTQTTDDAVSNDDVPNLFAESPIVSFDDNPEITTQKTVFLIIEEINRGNCAQIFGDLFQLLDRSDNGFSEYPIEADTDLQQEIERAFKEHKDYKLNNAISAEGAVKDYTSNYDATLSEDIQSGRVLLLPPNLYIWATMNTSDQSLFPIDSAFKRRWEWKYMPIKNHEDKGYSIEIGETKYDWWGFLTRINHVINDTTNSEDKKLGYFFAKVKGKTIDAEQFVGKVLFYLWNDVFKSYGFDSPIFSKDENKKFEFSDFFMNDGNPNTESVNQFLRKLEETIKMKDLPMEIKPNATENGQGEYTDTL